MRAMQSKTIITCAVTGNLTTIEQTRICPVTPEQIAGLLTVMAVGLFVEGVIFRGIEKRTVRRWGMQRG